jgi:hypothetical protein
MIERTVSEQLQYAILSILMSRPDREHQDYWASWETEVTKKMHGVIFTNDDLRWAFEALMQHESAELTKPDANKKHATKYVMQYGIGVEWRAFFLNGPFNVKMTRSGVRYFKTLNGRTIKLVSPSSV